MKKTDADSILQITNDLRIEKGGLAQIYEILFREQQYGMISPILLKKDSEIVENYGAEIDFSNMLFRHIDRNVHYKDVKPDIAFRTGLSGGCFLTKRVVYETIGLQDERINMYSDEVDTGIKCANKGYTLLSTKLVKSWHQHIFPSGRNPKELFCKLFYVKKSNLLSSQILWSICHIGSFLESF